MKIKQIKRGKDDHLDYAWEMRLSKKLSNAIQCHPYTDEGLITSLTNSLRDHDRDTISSLIAGFFGWDLKGDTIITDGQRIQQLFELLGEEPPIEIDCNEMYEVDVESLRKMVARAAPGQADIPDVQDTDRVPKNTWYMK